MEAKLTFVLILFFFISVVSVSASLSIDVGANMWKCDSPETYTIKVYNTGDTESEMVVLHYAVITPSNKTYFEKHEVITEVPKSSTPKLTCLNIGGQYEILDEACLIKIIREVNLPANPEIGVWKVVAQIKSGNETYTGQHSFKVGECEKNWMPLILAFAFIYLLLKYGGNLL